jgi:hypothetical protein
MRALLALINLNLEYESRGDSIRAARSLAAQGIGHHTRAAASHFKAAGYDVSAIVTQYAFMDVASYKTLINEIASASKRHEAAKWALGVIGSDHTTEPHEADQAICTALLAMIYKPRAKWTDDMAGLEALIQSVKTRKSKSLPAIPKDIPAMYAEAIDAVWGRYGLRILTAINESQLSIHALAGSVDSDYGLAGLLLSPDRGSISEIDDMSKFVTSHWKKLSKGRSDDETLMTLMVSALMLNSPKVSLTAAEIKKIASMLNAAPSVDALINWLDSNAPHNLQASMVQLWKLFWSELDLLEPITEARRLRFLKEWINTAKVPRATTST